MTAFRTKVANAALAAALVLLCCGLAAVAALKSIPQPAGTRYVGSQSCKGCHAKVFAAWSESQHTKMMRRPDQEGVLVADFESPDPDRRFTLEEVAWVMGGKWEQQFMGHDGETETLLPGAWMHLSGEWDFKGWDGWQVPVPLRRCHGCHTVGLDVETGDFVEPNIGCESCHGPSSWHVDTWGFGRVTSTTDADACGQCHVRGKDPSGKYFFPVDYRPGDDLMEHFVPENAFPDQDSSHWWRNGHARDRHQEYAGWVQGGHADSLRSLRESYDGRFGPVTDDCLGCHAADAILQPWKEVSASGATQPITCSVCHNAHGALDQLRMACGDCHGEGAFYHTPERNADHVPCPETAQVGCADCHMPLTAKIGGRYALHSHSPGIITPREAERRDMPSSCSNGPCHVGAPAERFDAHLTTSTPPLHPGREDALAPRVVDSVSLLGPDLAHFRQGGSPQ